MKCWVGFKYLEYVIIFSIKCVIVCIVWIEKYSFVIMVNGRRGENGFSCFVFLNDFVGFIVKSEYVCLVFSYGVDEYSFVVF